jgi:hypothetical protein
MNMPIHYDLSFPAPDERYDLDRQAVVFWGRDVDLRRFRELTRVRFPKVTRLTGNQACN